MNYPDSKVHGPTWGPPGAEKDLGGPRVGHLNLVIWEDYQKFPIKKRQQQSFNMIFIQNFKHYSDVKMSAMASQITSVSIVYSTICSGAEQGKHQSSESLAFVRGIHRAFPAQHKGPVTRKIFPFDDVIMKLHIIVALFSDQWISEQSDSVLWKVFLCHYFIMRYFRLTCIRMIPKTCSNSSSCIHRNIMQIIPTIWRVILFYHSFCRSHSCNKGCRPPVELHTEASLPYQIPHINGISTLSVLMEIDLLLRYVYIAT